MYKTVNVQWRIYHSFYKMVISINPLCSCNEIPQFAALQPPKVQTQRLQKTNSLSFLYFGYFFISCFFMSHFNPPKVHIKRLHKQLSLSFLFWGICFLFHVFFMPHFNLSKVHIQRLHKKLSLSLFVLDWFIHAYVHVYWCRTLHNHFLTFHSMFLFL